MTDHHSRDHADPEVGVRKETRLGCAFGEKVHQHLMCHDVVPVPFAARIVRELEHFEAAVACGLRRPCRQQKPTAARDPSRRPPLN